MADGFEVRPLPPAPPVPEDAPPPPSLATQVGGSHYRRFKIQPITFIRANKLDFLTGNVIKYVVRAPFKGGVEDLHKARHYLDMMIEDAEEQRF